MASKKLSYDAKTIITVIVLFAFYPVGVILMFKWMDWPKWVKILVALPILLMAFAAIIGLMIAIAAISLN